VFVNLDRSGPIYKQIYENLRVAILEGRLKAGERLPSTRELAQNLGVSRNTALLAYDQLAAEGYISGNIGSGSFVTAILPESVPRGLASRDILEGKKAGSWRLSAYAKRLPATLTIADASTSPKIRYDFQYGSPAVRDFPDQLWQRAILRRLRHASMKALGYGPAEGYEPLRTAIAAYLKRSRGVECEARQILIVNGSQQALDLAARVLLDPNDSVVLEDPHYQGARQVFQSARANLIPIPVDSEGLKVDLLPKKKRNLKVAYLTPSHQFPTGAIMPVARRLDLLAWAREVNACILEDDYDGEFRYEGWPVKAAQGLDPEGRVIYIGTFSKSLFPSLRLGYLVLPDEMIKPFVAAKFLADRQVPMLEQLALADFIQEGHFERHLRRSRMRNASRRKALLESLEKYFGKSMEISGANAGVHLLVWLNSVSRAELPVLMQRAADAGVGIYPVSPYYLKQPRRAGLLLGYASLTEDEIRAGIRILASVM